MSAKGSEWSPIKKGSGSSSKKSKSGSSAEKKEKKEKEPSAKEKAAEAKKEQEARQQAQSEAVTKKLNDYISKKKQEDPEYSAEKLNSSSLADLKKALVEIMDIDESEINSYSEEEIKALRDMMFAKIKHSDFLDHSGVLGQRWGKRNGPPYPLSRQKRFGGTEKNKSGGDSSNQSAKTQTKKHGVLDKFKAAKSNRDAKKVERVKNSILKDPRKLYKYRNKFSNAEKEEALKRFDLDKRLAEAAREKRQRGSKFISDIMSYANQFKKAYELYTDTVKTNYSVTKSRKEITKLDAEINKLTQEIKNTTPEGQRKVREQLDKAEQKKKAAQEKANNRNRKKRAKHWDMDADYFLAHHGIKGQKWGKRNGPPYPLDRQKKSKAKSNSKDKTKYGIDPLTAMYVASWVATGAGIAVKAGKAAKGKLNTNKILTRQANAKKDKKTGLPLKEREFSEKEDIKNVNPMRNSILQAHKAGNNCMLCSIAYEMRKRGYDVSAALDTSKGSFDFVEKAFPGSKRKVLATLDRSVSKGQTAFRTDVLSKLNKEPIGSRGTLCVRWKALAATGHSLYYENTESGLKIIDTQSAKIIKPAERDRILRMSDEASIVRWDNRPFNKNIIRNEAVTDYESKRKGKK